ncbi:MAG: hypothetical protein ACRETW_05410 [Stenotrophobium sp.]
MHEVIAVANDFIARGQREGLRDLSAHKLHALVYLVCCYWMARDDAPRVTVMACRDGVFLPELREHGCWGTRRVADPITLFAPASPEDGMIKQHIPRMSAQQPASRLLDWVWNTYAKRSAYDLGQLTRDHGTPWDQVWNHPARRGDEAREIPQSVLEQWFFDTVQRRVAPRPAHVAPQLIPQAANSVGQALHANA